MCEVLKDFWPNMCAGPTREGCGMWFASEIPLVRSREAKWLSSSVRCLWGAYIMSEGVEDTGGRNGARVKRLKIV